MTSWESTRARSSSSSSSSFRLVRYSRFLLPWNGLELERRVWFSLSKQILLDFDYFRTIALGLKQALPGTFYTKNMKVDKKLLDSMEKKVTIQDSKDPAHSQEIEVYVPESSGSVADSAANSSQQPLLK